MARLSTEDLADRCSTHSSTGRGARREKRPHRIRSIVAILFAVSGAFCAGCGGDSVNDDANDSGAQSGSTSAAAQSNQSAAPSGGKQQPTPRVRTDSDGRKWIDDIPYDVFYDDPLAIVANDQRVTSSPTPSAPIGSEANTQPAAQDNTPPEETSSDDWDSVITADALENEIREIRNELNSQLQTLGKYNLSYVTMPVDCSVLSAVAAILNEHSAEPSWKANVLYIRDLAAKMVESATARGRPAYEETRTAFDNISDILNGTLPPGLDEPAADATFADVIERSYLMTRFEQQSEWLRSNAGSEQSFQSNMEEVRQESAVLGALVKVIMTPGYDSAEDDEYREFANALFDASRAMVNATDESDFAAFDAALTKVYQSCTDCHGFYRD